MDSGLVVVIAPTEVRPDSTTASEDLTVVEAQWTWSGPGLGSTDTAVSLAGVGAWARVAAASTTGTEKTRTETPVATSRWTPMAATGRLSRSEA